MLNFNEEKETGQQCFYFCCCVCEQNTIRYGLVYVFVTIEIF